jgi:1-acyl-sn-glycerol-3-phosphate acyltransferase
LKRASGSIAQARLDERRACFFKFAKEYNPCMPDSLARLTDINLDDLVNSIGWQDSPRLAKLLRILSRPAARKFARQMQEFDSQVDESDLTTASRYMLEKYVKDVRVYGLERIPSQGPILALSNHPGMTDTLCLFAAINRPDLRIIALDRPFLQSLPNVSRQLFFISDNSKERLSAVRKAAAHLRGGGAVLTFPAGKIEPDPKVYPGALESLNHWTDSAGVFLRLAPETRILPMLVSGVLWKKVVSNPFTKLKKVREDREKLGAAFQLLAQVIFNLHPLIVTVQVGEPVGLTEIRSTEISAIHEAVLTGMRFLIENPPQGESAFIRGLV